MPETKAEAKAGQTTIGAMVAGFDPSEGDGWFEKLGPGIALILLIAMKVAIAMDTFSNPEALTGVSDLLMLAVGGWAGRLGAK